MADIFPTIPCPDAISGFAWVYVLQSADGAFYIGQTVNLRERLRKHRLGLGSKHTEDHAGTRLIYCDGPFLPEKAVQREAQLKGWSRAKKEALIRGDYEAIRQLSKRARQTTTTAP